MARESTDSGSGELTNAPTYRRGWMTRGGCAEGVSIPGGSGSQLVGMSFLQSGTLVLGEPIVREGRVVSVGAISEHELKAPTSSRRHR